MVLTCSTLAPDRMLGRSVRDVCSSRDFKLFRVFIAVCSATRLQEYLISLIIIYQRTWEYLGTLVLLAFNSETTGL